jgi:hypothetical protein
MDVAVNSAAEQTNESPGIFQLIGQLEHIIDKLLDGYGF